MPKRKRSSSPEPADRTTKLCTARLASAQKALVAALRLGAGLERQKHGRRRKTALQSKDNTAVARLDAEYAVLKGLDLPQLAELHLRKTISRVKSIAAHPSLPASAKERARGIADPATLNVTARLYKVAGVKKAVDECIADLKSILGAGGPVKRPEQAKTVTVKEEDESDQSDDFQGFSDDGTNDDAAEDHDFADLEDRLAAPSSDDEDSDTSLPGGHMKMVSGNTTLSSLSSLPSLGHAAYIEGSDSEASDLEDFAPKKNRRGQRARQKIWEQKYGEKAKHKLQDERNKGWDAKRGAVDQHRSHGKVMRKGTGPQKSGGNDTEVGTRKEKRRDDAGVLHPSWLAAKAAKEKKLAVKPQGTKITFD